MIYSSSFFASFTSNEKKQPSVKAGFRSGFSVAVPVRHSKLALYWGEYLDAIVWSSNISVIISGIVPAYMEKRLLRN